MAVASKSGMTCPHCGKDQMIDVWDSRRTEFLGQISIRRRRQCRVCGGRMITYEMREPDIERLRRQLRVELLQKLAGMLE